LGPDLYSILGVARDAGSDAIRAAYRRLAKDAHPDHGNDPEAFRSLKDAYDVLSSPETRAHYDLTGETPADRKAREADEARYRQLLGDLLVTTIAQSGAPAFTDIVAEARRSVTIQMSAIEAELSSSRLLSQRIAEVMERLREPAEAGVVRAVLTERLSGIEARIASLVELHAQLGRLLSGLNDYGYDIQVENIL